MLTRMRIKGFRSFSQESYQEIKFANVSILVGENNVGKSNILKAIKFALDPNDSNIERENFSIRRSKSRSKRTGYTDKKARQIEICLYLDNVKILPKKYHNKVRKREYELKVVVSGSKVGKFEKKYYLDGKNILNMHFNNKCEKIKVYKELLQNISIHIAPTIRDIDYLEIFKEMLPLTGRSDIKKVVSEFTEKISQKMKPKLSVMRKQLGVEGVDFKPNVDLEKILYDTRFDFIINEGYHVSIKNVGQGYVSKSIIALALRSGRSRLVGIEEPELHMHPNAIRELLREIKEQNKQVIITSHSPTITNFVDPNEIIVVKKVKRYSKVYQLKSLFKEHFNDYVNIERQIFLNKQKTGFLFSKGIIFVEGSYDRIVFEKICEKNNINLVSKGLNIIDVGSDSAFIPYMMLAKTMNLRWVVIADRKAAYNPKNIKTGFGNYLKALRKYDYISNQEAKSLVNSITNNYVDYDHSLDAINKKLVKENGNVIFLKGDDISEEVVFSIRDMPHRDIKLLFQKFQGSRYDRNRKRVLNVCERKIRKKNWNMITAIEVISDSYLINFTKIINKCQNFLLK